MRSHNSHADILSAYVRTPLMSTLLELIMSHKTQVIKSLKPNLVVIEKSIPTITISLFSKKLGVDI